MGNSKKISRRTVIGGMVTTAAMPMLAARALGTQRTEPSAAKAKLSETSLVQPLPRHLHASVALADGRVLVTGGLVGSHHGTGMATNSVQIHDPMSDTWVSVAPMLSTRARHAAVLLPDQRVAVLGGFSISPLDSVEIYDPRSDTWTAGPALPSPICDHSAVIAKGVIVIHGGHAGATGHVLAVAAIATTERP